MLEPEEVDEGFFTPVASTTLASIFRSDSGNDESANASLKYKPPQPKKTEHNPKSEDPNASQCVFSCSIIAYEWLQGAHNCKGRVGFAVMRIINTGSCKIILYSPDKSTLSCTTMSPELQVALKRNMITLYDDHKKCWRLCFNDKIIDKVKEIFEQENVVIKDNDKSQENNSVPVQPEVESKDSDETEIETQDSNISEAITPALKNDKASILSRIANVGHAILPSTPASPVKKSIPVELNSSMETCCLSDRMSLMSDETDTTSIITVKELTRNIAKQASVKHHEVNNSTVPSNGKLDIQIPLPNLPIDNNQASTCVQGCMKALRRHVPVITNQECGITASEIGVMINRLTHLQGLVKTMEIIETIEKENNQTCPCKDKVHNKPNPENDSTDGAIEEQNKQNLNKISILEELIREKDKVILDLQNEAKIERIRNSDLLKEHNSNTKYFEREVEDLKHGLIIKDEEFKNMIRRSEADILMANTIKKLMNDTFRSLASNFESDGSYSGRNIKGILATVIKKHTVESLNLLLPNRSVSNVTTEPTD